MTKLVQNTNQYSNSDLDLHFYYEGKSSSEREFYFDDGKNPNAVEDNSNHEILNCSTALSKNLFTITLESKTASKELLSKGKNGTIFIYKFASQPKSILNNGKKADYKFNSKTKSLEIKYNHSSYKTDIKITF